MSDLTIITPVAPYHIDKIDRCVASVQAQTVPCYHIVAVDEKGRGAGWMRNRLLEQVRTKYVTFLDADDTLEPEFAETCINAIQPGRYVYTDWYEGDNRQYAPEQAWCGGTWHVVTTLLHTEDARRLGGFDETLPAIEDTDFYLKLTTHFICGIRIQKPLMRYSHEGHRSRSAMESGLSDQLKKELNRRYAGMSGCCGADNVDSRIPIGERQAGDILAQALWGGNRVEHGRATGRHYARISFPRTTWIDPRDAEAAPHLWRPVQTLEQPVPLEDKGVQLGGVDALQAYFEKMGVVKPGLPDIPLNVTIAPNFERVSQIASERLGKA